MNYQRIYDSIIDRAKSENRVKGGEIYYEAHHIIPTCMGGTGKCTEWNFHLNIVLLTGREHFLCHWLLHEIYPNNHKLAYAFAMMCNVKDKNQQRYVPSSRLINYIKKIVNENRKGPSNWIRSDEYKNKISITNSGKKHTMESKKKMSDLKKGKPLSEEHKRNIGRAGKGKIISKEQKEKLRQAAIEQHKKRKELNKSNELN